MLDSFPSLGSSPELQSLEDDLVSSEHHLGLLLTSTLAIQRDVGLRDVLGRSRIALALGEIGPYVIVEHGKIVGTAMQGTTPSGVDQIATVSDVLEAQPASIDDFETSLEHARPEALRTLAQIATSAEQLSRAGFSKLERWAPVLALHAYRHTVTIQSIFDLSRAVLHATSEPEQLRQYWERVHLLGHLTLLAASSEPVEWLGDMSRSFTWRVWTPSFPLVRERILRLAVRGGWASARFGVSAIAPYLQRLAVGAPLHAFDAVLGLVSLATMFESNRTAIAAELFPILLHREREADDPDIQLAFAAFTRSARLALDSPSEAQRLVIARNVERASRDRTDQLIEAVDTDEDAATIDDNGTYPAILAMTGLVNIPAHRFFPEQSTGPRWRPIRAQRRSLGRFVRESHTRGSSTSCDEPRAN
jgi:hypothetical protein